MGFVFGKKALLTFQETTEVLGCSKGHIYNLLRDGKLKAHNPQGKPGKNGTRILSASVRDYIEQGIIATEQWSE